MASVCKLNHCIATEHRTETTKRVLTKSTSYLVNWHSRLVVVGLCQLALDHLMSLIDKSDILDKEDLIYRMHWATRQASLNNEEMPAGLENGVVNEWHHALNWLAYYDDVDWDDVSTDT